ncbi:TlpA family protein disulfide reductase [Portibacter marinus]|uniref:TlpA family protein disulfide reductase n=1 Tax=Portibacter marinus TaxID=2898660 RepID=UPI001F2A43EC|nr:thioredoxin family protein [Portibacter marinus]
MFKVFSAIIVVGLLAGLGISRNNGDSETIVTSQDSLGQRIASHDFGADMYVGTHQNIEDLLAVIQKKYAGKAVIFDLWGTFCKPCLSDFKNSPAKKAVLKEEYDVHMVYLCAGMSSNFNEWKKVIERDQLVGDHIYLDNNLTMAYREKFDVKRYPNYILMDKEGNYKPNLIRAVSDIHVDNFKAHL